MATVFLAIVVFVLGEFVGFVIACLCIAAGRSDAHMEKQEHEKMEQEEDTDGSSL